MMKKILIFTIMIMMLLVSFVQADQTAPISQAGYNHADEVAPMYVPHTCHSGTAHRNCYLDYTMYYDCGCVTEKYNCCCGKVMPSVLVYYCGGH